MQGELGATVIQLKWVMNIYFLVLAVSMVAAGKLGHIFGHREIFYIGCTLFAVASVVAGFSLLPQMVNCFSLFSGHRCSDHFSFDEEHFINSYFFENEIPKALALSGTVGSMGLAIRPVLGGIITSLISWRAIFILNMPLYLIGLFIVLLCLPHTPTEKV
ncbi:MFS transporter [Candidatus Coxiella mudrowiae]|uniref:MFS transporter n=1 Tax=Candidatus Coxiella mudrowiae TaxID=2054173 RepID=UPI003144D3FC